MVEAKTLKKAELKRVINVTNSCSCYAARDINMLLLMFYADYAVET